MHEKSSESTSESIKRIPIPIHFVSHAVWSDDSVGQDIQVDRVAVTVREDPSCFGALVRFPPRFQNWSQLVPERYDSVLAGLCRRLLFAVDVSPANRQRRTGQINRRPLQSGDLAWSQARPDADRENTLCQLDVPIAPAIAVSIEVRYHRLDFFFGER